MRRFNRLCAVVVCCAMLFSMPAKAFWPVFDFTEIAPVISQVSTGIERVRNLKDQLLEMKNNLKAIGDKIKSFAQFAKDIADKVVNVANQVREGIEEIAGYVEKGKELVDNVVDAGEQVTGAVEDVVDTSVDVTEDIVDRKAEDGTPPANLTKPRTPSIPKAPTIPNTPKQTILPKRDVIIEGQQKTIPPQTRAEPTVGVNVKKNDKKTITLPDVTLDEVPSEGFKRVNINLDYKHNEEVIDREFEGVRIEEEEEEEEISPEEDNIKISAVKDNIKIALSETKDLNIQFNDMLDMSLYTLQQNSELNQSKIEHIKELINNAMNLSDTDKASFIQKVISLKEKEKNITNRAIGIIEAVKENYNREYKNKVEDGYKNYENIAIAYIKGDIDKLEFQKAGSTLKKNVKSINVTPDKLVINELNNSMKLFQDELTVFNNQVKEAEDKYMKANS